MIKIFTIAHVPKDMQQRWLQHLRDFDSANPGCHFQVFADAPDVSTEEVIKLMTVEPGLSFAEFFDRRKPRARAAPQGADTREAELVEGLRAAVRAANLAVFVIRKQGVMPNSSWESGFEVDLNTARDALAAAISRSSTGSDTP